MTVAFCLLLYSLVATVLAPRLLARCTRAGLAPGLGVVAWLTSIGTVLGSWVTAAGFVAVELARDWTGPRQTVLSDCFALLGTVAAGGYGAAAQFGVLLLGGVAAAAVVFLVARLGRSLRNARVATREHARMARVAGAHDPALGAVVLDVRERAAYCVAG